MLTVGRAASRQGFTTRMSALLDSLKRGRNRRRARQRDVQAAMTMEVLEQRTLLTNLVGVDLGGGGIDGSTTPANWTPFSSTSDTQLTDLPGETGPTGIDLFIDFDSTLQGGYDSFSPPGSQLPVHTQSLSGLDRNFADQGNIQFLFSDLTPGQDYEIYVFAGDTFSDNQRVTISGGSPNIVFTQPHAADQLIVNDTVGSSATPLGDFAEVMTADGSGEILVLVDTSVNPAGFFGVAGIAIEEVIPPPPAIILDNGDAGFSTVDGGINTNDNWFDSVIEGHDGDVHYTGQGDGTAVATWVFTGLTPGNYRVSATWSAHPNRATNTPFAIRESLGGPVLNSVAIDQEQAPNDLIDAGSDWEDLSIVTITGSTLVVEMANDADGYVIADAIRIQPTLDPPSLKSLIIDDQSNGADFEVTAGWNQSPIGEGRKNDVRYMAAGDGSEVATWTFSGLMPGNYIIAATWSEHANRATDAPFTIRETLGGPPLEVVRVNQELAPNDFGDSGSQWETLTTVSITGGTLVVELSNDADGFVIADAIRLEETATPPLPPGVIIDDGDVGFATIGGWSVSPFVEGREGDIEYRHNFGGAATATWTFTGLLPGTYLVSATWSANANRATDAPFTIYDGTDGGGLGPELAAIDINQEQAPDDFTTFGSAWENLATVTITGTELVVELTNDANEYVIADAIRVQPATPPTAPQALANYVYDVSNPSSYTFDSTFTGTGYTAYVLDLTSQTWRNALEVDKPVWQHWVTMYVPDTVVSDTAILFVDGGNNVSSAPTSGDAEAEHFATSTGMVTIHLRTVPSEPLIFSDEGFPRSEDEIIAYTFDKYLETGDETWPLLIAMVNSAVAAMDAAQDFDTTAGVDIQDFMVTGASKRGWTTWLTAAVDPRVKAIVPFVIDVLNMKPSLENHRLQYVGVTNQIIGGYSDSVHDYTDLNIFDRFDTYGSDQLRQIVDPYEYRDVLTMPKYLVHSAGDEFFVPNSSQFYFDDLLGPTYQRYVPNTGHGLNFDALEKATNFMQAIDMDLTLPEFDWIIENGGQDIRAIPGPDPGDIPVSVNLWQATNLTELDFRNSVAMLTWTSTPIVANGMGEFVGTVSAPASGGRAFFVEFTYNIGGLDLIFTTDINIVTPI